MVCPHGQGGKGLRQCGHFSDKGEESIFRNFVQTSFMDGPFSKTAPEKFYLSIKGALNHLIS